MAEPLWIAQGTSQLNLLPQMANRHGLVAGATGTGKTVTLQVMAEAFSRIGVPVFAADVKGDLAGISQAGTSNPKIADRVKKLKLGDFAFAGCPTTFWDVFGQEGHPVRATISEMGPLLLGRLLNLNDTQEGVLNLVFKIADDNHLLLLDLKDLQAMLQYVGDHARDFQTQYGNISAASIGAIQRGLLGNRVQHALRAFTPADQKAVKAAADTFRTNPKLDVAKAITELEVGEALVSFLDEKGTPGVVERAIVLPPHSQIGPITPEQRRQLMANSVVAGVYENAVDRESAYEVLKSRAGVSAPGAGAPGQAQQGPASPPWWQSIPGMSGGGRRGDTMVDAMAKSAARAIGSSVGRQIVRGVLGSLLGGSKK